MIILLEVLHDPVSVKLPFIIKYHPPKNAKPGDYISPNEFCPLIGQVEAKASV